MTGTDMPPNGPRVSVIMPFLDLEAFIEESIESVVAQTYPHWELLLIDDGSTDGSTEIARGYARAYPESIRYLAHENHENRGASASRNLGIRNARGEYIALLDADDVWVPSKLEEQVPLLDAHPEVGSLFGVTLYWYSWSGAAADRDRDEPSRLGFRDGTILQPPDLLIANLSDRAEPPCTCSLLMRRTVVEAVGGFEETFQRVFTDQTFYAKFFMAAPVYVSVACWDKYRRHDGSACAVEEAAGALDARRLQYLEWFRAYLIDQDQARGRLWRAVRRAIWFQHHPRLSRLWQEIRALPERAAALFWRTLWPLALRVARLALPQPVRHWLWTRWRRRDA